MNTDTTEDDDTERRSLCTRIKQALLGMLCPVNIDLKAYIPLLLILLSEGITSSSVNSYIGYLVVDVGAASDRDEAGTWSGILTSSFFFCQFISSFMMGYISDNFGRRPTLLIGVFGSFATQLCFGFSTNIWMAIALRGANGLLNGNVSVAKVCVAELTDKTNRVKAFSYVGLMGGVGRIIGSTLGGYTARPAIEYSDTFSSDGFFAKYPYALSNFCVSSIILFTFIITFFFVKETSKVLETKRAERARKKKQKKGHKYHSLEERGETDDDEVGVGMDTLNKLETYEPQNDDDEDHALLENTEKLSLSSGENAKSDKVYTDHTDDVFRHTKNTDDSSSDDNHNDDDNIITIEDVVKDDEEKGYDENEPQNEAKGIKWLINVIKENRHTILVILMYSLGSFVQATAFSQVSTWTVASIKSGGLDFTPSDVGITIAIGGVATVLSLAFVSGPLTKCLSVIVTTRLSGLILVPVFACMPLGNNIARHSSNAAVWGLEGVLVFLWQGAIQILFNTIYVLIPNSVPNEKLAMSQAFAQATGAAGKAIGPTVIGIVLKWSLLPGRHFPFNYFCIFFILSFVCLTYFILSFFVPKSINYPYGVYEKMLQEEKEKEVMADAEGVEEEEEMAVKEIKMK